MTNMLIFLHNNLLPTIKMKLFLLTLNSIEFSGWHKYNCSLYSAIWFSSFFPLNQSIVQHKERIDRVLYFFSESLCIILFCVTPFGFLFLSFHNLLASFSFFLDIFFSRQLKSFYISWSWCVNNLRFLMHIIIAQLKDNFTSLSDF